MPTVIARSARRRADTQLAANVAGCSRHPRPSRSGAASTNTRRKYDGSTYGDRARDARPRYPRRASHQAAAIPIGHKGTGQESVLPGSPWVATLARWAIHSSPHPVAIDPSTSPATTKVAGKRISGRVQINHAEIGIISGRGIKTARATHTRTAVFEPLNARIATGGINKKEAPDNRSAHIAGATSAATASRRSARSQRPMASAAQKACPSGVINANAYAARGDHLKSPMSLPLTTYGSRPLVIRPPAASKIRQSRNIVEGACNDSRTDGIASSAKMTNKRSRAAKAGRRSRCASESGQRTVLDRSGAVSLQPWLREPSTDPAAQLRRIWLTFTVGYRADAKFGRHLLTVAPEVALADPPDPKACRDSDRGIRRIPTEPTPT